LYDFSKPFEKCKENVKCYRKSRISDKNVTCFSVDSRLSASPNKQISARMPINEFLESRGLKTE
jgi:hypothetical protein